MADGAPGAAGEVLGRRGAVGFVAPAIGLIGIFLLFPALWTLWLGVTNLELVGVRAAEPEFIGVRNFVQALVDARFHNSLWVTLLFVAGSALIGQAVLGFTLAWVLRGWRGWLRQAFEVVVIIAWILPASVVAFLWIALLGRDGTLNQVLPLIDQFPWLLERPLLSIIVFNIWRGTAFSMLLFAAALNSIPPSYLETARLAGASLFQQLRDIVIPRLRAHILTVALLISLWTFNLFTPFLITGGGPGRQTEILPIFIYESAIRFGKLGYGAALSAIMLLINFVIALIYLRIGRERTA